MEYIVCMKCGDILKAPEGTSSDSPDVHVVIDGKQEAYYCTPCMNALLRDTKALRAEYPNRADRDAFWRRPGRKAAWRKLHPTAKRGQGR